MEKDFSLEGQMKEIFGEKGGKMVFEQITECAKQLDKEKEATANEVCDKKSNVKKLNSAIKALIGQPDVIKKHLCVFAKKVVEVMNTYAPTIGFETNYMKVEGTVVTFKPNFIECAEYSNIAKDLYDICESISFADKDNMVIFYSMSTQLVWEARRSEFRKKIASTIKPDNGTSLNSQDKMVIARGILLLSENPTILKEVLFHFGALIAKKLKECKYQIPNYDSDIIAIKDWKVIINENVQQYEADRISDNIIAMLNDLHCVCPTIGELVPKLNSLIVIAAEKNIEHQYALYAFYDAWKSAVKDLPRIIELLVKEGNMKGLCKCTNDLFLSISKEMRKCESNAWIYQTGFLTISVRGAEFFAPLTDLILCCPMALSEELCNIANAVVPKNKWMGDLFIKFRIALLNEINIEKHLPENEITEQQNVDYSALLNIVNKDIEFLSDRPELIKSALTELGKELVCSLRKVEPKAIDFGFKFMRIDTRSSKVQIDDDFMKYKEQIGRMFYSVCTTLSTKYSLPNSMSIFLHFMLKLAEFVEEVKSERVELAGSKCDDSVPLRADDGAILGLKMVKCRGTETVEDIVAAWACKLVWQSTEETPYINLALADGVFDILGKSLYTIKQLIGSTETNVYATMALEFLVAVTEEKYVLTEFEENLEYILRDTPTRNPETVKEILESPEFGRLIIETQNLEKLVAKAIDVLSSDTEKFERAMMQIRSLK